MRRLSVLMAAVALVVGACGSSAEPAEPAAAAEPSVTVEFSIVPYNREDVFGSGDELGFESLLGQGMPVMLNFFSANCPPCVAEMPWFEAVAAEYEDEVLLVGVDIGPFVGLADNEEGAQLLEDLDITYAAAYAVDDAPLRQLGVVSMPTTAFFDGQGELLDTHAGILTENQIESAFQQLAAGES
jgi:thiol-disulfide isomerase/thioredoxin